MELNFLGGAMEVGGSSILLNISNKNILLDAGLRQSAGKDPIPNFRMIQENGGLDAIIISHAHLDHIGCLPLVSKEYPGARIYMNHMTKELVRVLLYDSLKVMNGRDEEIPIYAENDVVNTLNRIFPIHFEHTFEIFTDIQITLYPAGHIAGASCIYIQTKEGTLFYSGDFSTFPQKTIEGIRIPRLRPDVAILESTYGDKLHSNRQVEEMGLINLVKECIENKGKMLIPAFALGRAQEVLLILKSAMNKKILPEIPVYVDGMVRDINIAYLRNPLYLKNTLAKRIFKGIEPFYDEHIIAVKPMDKREDLVEMPGSAIFVSSSGMLTGGPSATYARLIAPKENGYIVITGYQDEESPGRKILALAEETNEERILQINGLHIPVKCMVKKVGLSAHGDKNEIKGLVEKISPKNIFFVHGNQEVIEGLGKEINEEFWGRIYTPICGESYQVEIRNPRKQFKKNLPFTMQKKEEFMVLNQQDDLTKSHCKELWAYIREHYENKALTIVELFYIWSGIHTEETEMLTAMQKVLSESGYFENDAKRLFLLRAISKEDVKKNLEEKELTPQQLEVHVKELFEGYSFKKISFRIEEKSIILNFDFPQAVPDMEERQQQFKDLTGWNIDTNKRMNNNAASMLLKQMFADRIKKISFYSEKQAVRISLHNKAESDNKQAEAFLKMTGWQLLMEGDEIEGADEFKEQYTLPVGVPALEQNMAFQYIEDAFFGEEHRPYKKGIKADSVGKYIELSFISPMIGEKYIEVINKAILHTGWRMKISQSTNLNEVVNQVKFLCSQHGIVIQKNPSYQNASRTVEIKISEGEAALNQVKELVLKTTGCTLEKHR